MTEFLEGLEIAWKNFKIVQISKTPVGFFARIRGVSLEEFLEKFLEVFEKRSLNFGI